MKKLPQGDQSYVNMFDPFSVVSSLNTSQLKLVTVHKDSMW